MNNTVTILAASLGGPPLVNDILSSLPSGYDFPLIVLQQMESDFSEPLTSAWSKTSALNLIRLTHRELLKSGCAYVIPPNVIPVFNVSGNEISIRPESSGTDNVDRQWAKAIHECLRQFEGNIVLVLLADGAMNREGFGRILDSIRIAGGTVIYCKESHEMPKMGEEDENPEAGRVEMDIDQIVSYLQKLALSIPIKSQTISNPQEHSV